MNYQRDEHRVHLIVFHLIWCPKRRKAVLIDKVAEDCRSLIATKCEDQGWTLVELAIQPDHIHLVVRAWPSDSATDIVKHCKNLTSRILRDRYPCLKKLPSLWTRSYFASTADNVSAETVRRYIEAQKGL